MFCLIFLTEILIEFVVADQFDKNAQNVDGAIKIVCFCAFNNSIYPDICEMAVADLVAKIPTTTNAHVKHDPITRSKINVSNSIKISTANSLCFVSFNLQACY